MTMSNTIYKLHQDGRQLVFYNFCAYSGIESCYLKCKFYCTTPLYKFLHDSPLLLVDIIMKITCCNLINAVKKEGLRRTQRLSSHSFQSLKVISSERYIMFHIFWFNVSLKKDNLSSPLFLNGFTSRTIYLTICVCPLSTSE